MGLRPAATGRLLLEDVRAARQRPARRGQARGLRRVRATRSRVAWCALAVGAAQAVLDYVIQYVNERTAFGEPISNRQGVAFARLRHRHRDRRHAARHLPGGQPRRPAARTSPARRRSPAGSAPSKGMQIGSEGVQLLGGHGFVKEHPVERWYRDLRAAGVMEGALLV